VAEGAATDGFKNNAFVNGNLKVVGRPDSSAAE
jgi:hypothetical protein